MDDILVQQQGGVATVTLNRPHVKNAVKLEMWGEIARHFRRLGDDPAVRVIVFTGAGGDFSSGADLSAPEGPEIPFFTAMRQVNEAAKAVYEAPKPTIGRVEGVAVGAGANLALACDFVIAADTARFGEIFARRGLAVDFGGSWLLPRLVGLRRALELVLLADMISGTEAADIGLITRAVPSDELGDEVGRLAKRLAGSATVALAESKQLLRRSFDRTLDEALEAEAHSQAVCLASEDVREAMAAFHAKRKPAFKGC
ncbi:MAG: enoyl-CoA hydratase-related protein [Acidimicrobiales bacterium]